MKSNKFHIHVLSFKLAPLSATLHVCPGHPARTGRCLMPHGRGEHATCHHASATDVIARVVNIKPSSNGMGWWTGFSGGPDFRAVIFYVWHTEYHGHQSPMWSSCDLIASWARRPKNHGFTTNPRTRKTEMN